MPGDEPAGPSRYAGDVPGSEVCLGEILEHHLVELCLCLHAAVELSPELVGGLGDLENSAGVCNGLALGKQLFSSFELADDLALVCDVFVSCWSPRPSLAC